MRLIDPIELKKAIAVSGILKDGKTLGQIIDSLPDAQPQWIPVSERLPEDDTKVLCCTATKKGTLNIVIGYHYEDIWACGMNSNVIAWMELPEPYKS